tara:strand:- start:350 stop:616 length:267 start_codon:yes stop_codon:yes gene_type:complete
MSEHDEVVEYQRVLLMAEEWAKGVRTVHVHSLSSMWYDTRPQDTADKAVTDTEYNNGVIKRSRNGVLIHTFGKALKGKALVESYGRNT